MVVHHIIATVIITVITGRPIIPTNDITPLSKLFFLILIVKNHYQKWYDNNEDDVY